MQGTLNVLIFYFLGISLTAVAVAIYFRFWKPRTPKNDAIIGISYLVLSAAYTASVASAWVFIGLKPSFIKLFIAAVPIYLAWTHLGKRSSEKMKK